MKINKPSPGINTITTRFYHITRDANGIIRTRIIPDAHIELDDIEECEKLALKLNNGKKMLRLVDASSFHTLTPEATNY